MVVTISPSLSLYKIVVLPAASRPTCAPERMRASPTAVARKRAPAGRGRSRPRSGLLPRPRRGSRGAGATGAAAASRPPARGGGVHVASPGRSAATVAAVSARGRVVLHPAAAPRAACGPPQVARSARRSGATVRPACAAAPKRVRFQSSRARTIKMRISRLLNSFANTCTLRQHAVAGRPRRRRRGLRGALRSPAQPVAPSRHALC